METPAISFITVSQRPEMVQKLEASLRAATGGITWELTVVDGRLHDLFRGYNRGAKQSRADRLVFLHDDVQLMGNALTWERPLKLVDDPAVGFIGIAESRRLEAWGTWWGGNLTQEETFGSCRGMVWYPAEDDSGVKVNCWPSNMALFGRVLVVDGTFLLCHCRTFDALRGFDEQTFQGYHFYDVDITFRAALAGLINHVAPIPLLHASMGRYDFQWQAARQIFAKKYAAVLPRWM